MSLNMWILCIVVVCFASKSIGGRSRSENLEWKGLYSDNVKYAIKAPSPPDHKDHIAMARYIMHQAGWTSLATLSRIPEIQKYPFTSIVSMSDGTVLNSTGVPYFYLTPLDFPSKDLEVDSRCSISVSLMQTDFCKSKSYEADDPRCARVMITGRMEKMKNGTAEYDFAKDALFSRHPSMKNLPANHGFYVAKLEMKQIVMLAWFGGPTYIPIDQYLAFKQ